LLVEHFLEHLNLEMSHRSEEVSADALAALMRYDWPGNVRELRNVVERAIYRWDDGEAPVEQIEFDPFASPWQPVPVQRAEAEPAVPSQRPRVPDPASVTDLRSAIDSHERAIVEAALAANRFNQRQTAKALGLSYDQLRHTLKKHGLMERGAG
jgi:psp operon transcriptional activator